MWLKLPFLRVWIYLTSNHIPTSPLSAIFFSPIASCTFRWMWSCSQRLMQLPSELQYPLVSLSIATSSSLHAFIYCCAIQSSGRECVLSCFSANGSKILCSSTSSAYTTPVILHSCPLFMPLSCLNQEHLAGNKSKGLWEGFHKQMWCVYCFSYIPTASSWSVYHEGVQQPLPLFDTCSKMLLNARVHQSPTAHQCLLLKMLVEH